MNDAAAAISPAVQGAPQRATWRFLLANPLHVIAIGFGSGLAPRAPGTVGTLWAWAAFLILRPYLDDAQWAWLIGAGFALGCWASAVTARHLGKADPGWAALAGRAIQSNPADLAMSGEFRKY